MFRKLIIATLASIIALLVVSSTTVVAEGTTCYGPYGEEIECPVVNKSFSVEKVVRKAGETEWVNTLQGLEANQTVEFKITVKNTGEATVSNVRLADVLPANLSFVDGATEWMLDDFSPSEEREFTLTARTNVTGIAENQEKCVANIANLYYNDHKEASDVAVVCVKRGQVLPATQLPKTGSVSSQLIGILLMGTIAGLIVYTNTRIAKHVYGKR